MSIETTINIQIEMFDKLRAASEKTDRSKSGLIIMAIERLIERAPDPIKSFERIRYQKRDPEQEWARPHVRLREDEYEYALDLRKFFKMSFSAIVAMALEKYLDEIIMTILCPEKERGRDNYTIRNYIMVKDTIDSIISWRIYWGIPRDLSVALPTGTG